MPQSNSLRRLIHVEAHPPIGTDAAGLLADLLTRSAGGDEDAFAELYDATAPRIFGLVLRVLRNYALAEEVSQEVYIQVWRESAKFDMSKGSALSWLMTLAHRRAVDRVRSTERGTRRDAAYQEVNGDIEHDETVAAVETSMDAARVRSALESLTPTQKQVLELAYFDGRTHTEVAQIVGIPLGTAKTRIRDGLIRLRALVGEER